IEKDAQGNSKVVDNEVATDGGKKVVQVPEREKYRKLIKDAPIDDGVAELDMRFRKVIAAYSVGGPANWNGLRYAAGPLLVNLSMDEKWLTRVRVVLGMDAYVRGLESAAYTIGQLASAVKDGMIRDQVGFVTDYQEMVQHLQYQSQNLAQVKRRLAELQVVNKERADNVTERTTEVEKNRTSLTELTAKTNTEIARLEAIQNDLFKLQQQMGRALDATRSMEEQLRKRAGTPRP